MGHAIHAFAHAVTGAIAIMFIMYVINNVNNSIRSRDDDNL